jgi:hypothetical protein
MKSGEAMSEMDYQVMELAHGKPVKMWTNGVTAEDHARTQLRNTAQMPFVFRHVAVMPDVHPGKGSTIGSVIPTKGAIIPAAVGVDIGCGMMAVRTTLTASDLPDSLAGTARCNRTRGAARPRAGTARSGRVGYGQDVLNLVLAKGYLAKLLENESARQYVAQRHPDLMVEFESIIATISLDQQQFSAAL